MIRYYLIFAIALTLLGKASMDQTTAQSLEERTLENTIPAHLPIKVSIPAEKEKAFKDFDNLNWVRDFELEVKNTGERPIYHLLLTLDVAEAEPGKVIGLALAYGRRELADRDAQITREDIPIKPGESIVLKLNEVAVTSWEKVVRAGNRQNRVHHVKVVFLWLVLEDGTGFYGTSGAPWRRPHTVKASMDRTTAQSAIEDTIRTKEPGWKLAHKKTEEKFTSYRWTSGDDWVEAHVFVIPSSEAAAAKLREFMFQIPVPPKETLKGLGDEALLYQSPNTNVCMVVFRRGNTFIQVNASLPLHGKRFASHFDELASRQTQTPN